MFDEYWRLVASNHEMKLNIESIWQTVEYFWNHYMDDMFVAFITNAYIYSWNFIMIRWH